MHWIVHETPINIRFRDLISELEKQNTPYTVVRKASFTDDLTATGFDGSPIPLAPIAGPVFVFGATAMKKASASHHWDPGFIDAPTQKECLGQWGVEMLNCDARFGKLIEIEPLGDQMFFLRPDQPGKEFAGKVMNSAVFEDWRRDVLAGSGYPRVSPDTRVMIAPLKAIWAEYRCILIDGAYVTGSRYKTGRIVAPSGDVGARVVHYAEARAADWCPRRAMCIDVADTPEGLKVIETNAISSAGLYAHDLAKYVKGLNSIK